MINDESKDITRFEAILASKILECPYSKDECSFSYFEGDDKQRYTQGMIPLDTDEEINIIFSVPEDGKSIFITVSDGDEREIKTAITNVERADQFNPILFGNVLPFKAGSFSNKDIFGIIFLSVKTMNILNFLPDTLEIDGSLYTLLLVAFITNYEHEIWKEKGHDALMDYFPETNKDLIAF